MATVKATIISADTSNKTATIVVEFDDGSHTWQKTYTLHKTEAMKYQDFKDMVAADLRRDLQMSSQLDNIKPQVGKSFQIVLN